ncbi:Ribonuclease H [Geodia barretti]|uniref:ribonuclease H n=1 Tax=Geodia barretti TaxID=519541 RepID=A0AA35X0X1_GEOBA|nr:Ribonuclease H [Geodia barretti]
MEVRDKRASQSQGYKHTTNNRMELMGAAETLDLIDNVEKVILITDSEYLVSAMTRGWAKRWRKNQWVKQDGEKAKNTDLWKRILHASDRLKRVEFRWVRGHAKFREAFGSENAMCDKLAKEAAGQPEEKLAGGRRVRRLVRLGSVGGQRGPRKILAVFALSASRIDGHPRIVPKMTSSSQQDLFVYSDGGAIGNPVRGDSVS